MNNNSIFNNTFEKSVPVGIFVEHVNLRKRHYRINAPDISELDVRTFGISLGIAEGNWVGATGNVTEGVARCYLPTLHPTLNEILQIDLCALFSSRERVQQVLTEQQFYDARGHIKNACHRLPHAYGVLQDPFRVHDDPITAYSGPQGEGMNKTFSTIDIMLLAQYVESKSGRNGPVCHDSIVRCVHDIFYTDARQILDISHAKPSRILYNGILYDALLINEVIFSNVFLTGYPIRPDLYDDWSNQDPRDSIEILHSNAGLMYWLDIFVPRTAQVCYPVSDPEDDKHLHITD